MESGEGRDRKTILLSAPSCVKMYTFVFLSVMVHKLITSFISCLAGASKSELTVILEAKLKLPCFLFDIVHDL